MVDIDCLEGLKLLYYPDSLDRRTLLLVSSAGEGDPNVMPFSSWSISHVDPYGWCLAVYVFTRHHTYALVKQTGQFTVNVPRDGMDDIMKQCGSVSGRDHDKFAESGLTAVASRHVVPPVIDECSASFECEVYNKYPFLMTFPGEDKESIEMMVFEGQILATHAGEDTNSFL